MSTSSFKATTALAFAVISVALPTHTIASMIQVTGSFSSPTSTGYMYDLTYNQDDHAHPTSVMPANTNAVTNSVSYFGWGIDWRDSYMYHQTIQSHFWFNGTGSIGDSNTTSFNLGEAFSLGTFTYTNEETYLSGGYVEIDFNMNILVDGVALLPSTYRIGINNTPNDSTPPYDTASLISGPESILFDIEGIGYTLTFNGFTRDNGNSFETYANLPEGQQTSAQIYATITAVPVPAALVLMASGLITLLGFSRKRTQS